MAKPAMATRIGVLMTSVKFTASSSALILSMHRTHCHALHGRDDSQSCVCEVACIRSHEHAKAPPRAHFSLVAHLIAHIVILMLSSVAWLSHT